MSADDSSLIDDPSLATLGKLFNITTWENGEDCADQGDVTSITVNPDPNACPGWMVDAMVRAGSQHNSVQIDLGRDDADRWHFSSCCDCKASQSGDLCKHQAAVLNVLAEKHPEIVPFFPEKKHSKPLVPAWAAILQPTAEPSPPPPPPPPPPMPVRAPVRAPVAPPPPPPAPSPLDLRALQWLGELARSIESRSQQRGASGVADDEVILFELGEQPPQKDQGLRLTLMPVKAKRLKSGELGKLQSNPHSLRRSLGAVEDAELHLLLDSLEGMIHCTDTPWNQPPWGTLTSHLALPTLQRALASGRVVSRLPDGQASEPWQWGEARLLSWRWDAQELPAREMTREMGLDEPGWRIVPVVLGPDGQEAADSRAFIASVSFYRDEARRCVGPLLLDGRDWQQAWQWCRAPLLREGWLRQRRDDLRECLPSLPATVAEPVVRRIHGQAPVPVLTLSWVPEGRSQVKGMYYPLQLSLAFDYAGVRGYWATQEPEQQFVRTSAGLVELERQPEAEAGASQHLRAFATLRRVVENDDQHPNSEWWLGGPKRPNPVTLLSSWLSQDFAPLRELGFKVEFDHEWGAHGQRVDDLDAALSDGERQGWLDLAIGFVIGEQRVNLLPLLPQILASLKVGEDGRVDIDTLPERLWLYTEDGQWWNLPSAPLKPWLDTLIELLGDRPREFDADKLRLSPMDALRMGADAANFGQNGHAALRDILATRQPEAPLPALPVGLHATPRPYQHQGFAWLRALAANHLGGVLADDMGLGKTLQTITHLLNEVRSGAAQDRPSLVVAPTSLMGNWRRECQRFAPELRVLVLHGSARHELHDRIAAHDVVLTTYPLMQRDIEILAKTTWHALVLDEAQMLKNAHTLTAQAARRLQASHRLALTGTPMENHLGELWSLFDVVLPGYLGRESRFTSLFRNPIERQGDGRRLALLRRRLAPFMLRRDKSMVATELPPKIEQLVRVQLDEGQANLYETIRASAESTVREALAEKGLARSHITVLDALLKLRQACCDPRLVKLQQARLIQESAKLGWLMENLPQMLEEGRRVLLFSQFTSMLDLIGQALNDAGITWTTLTGQTRDREAAIARFTSGQVPVFLISLKAGGTGLNLPQADTVIHYDPWWNPAAESQATDRAHRMGQTQTVFVYKLVAEGTVEERIVAMQSHKAELARGVQAAGRLDEERRTSLSENDLDWLLQPLGAAAAADDEALVREAQAHAIAPRPSSSHLLEIGEAESLTEALAEEGV